MKLLTPILLLILFLSAHSTLVAQEKADYVWVFGYSSDLTEEYDSLGIFGNSIMDFNTDPPTVDPIPTGLDMDYANTSICDENGDLLFYTNGVEIGTKTHEIMENSEYLYDNSGGWPLRIDQGVLILPYPGQSKKYVLIHCNQKFIQLDFTSTISTLPLYYSIIDMEQNTGFGIVAEKKIVLKQDTLQFGKLTAARHANGRDWWLLVPKLFSSKMYKFLLTPAGFTEMDAQILPDILENGPGQAVFSPDGSVFAYLSLYYPGTSDIQIFHFDRCSGVLNPLARVTEPDYNTLSGGLAISPNSRFLYHASLYELYQYDLWADDIEASKDTIAVFDGIEESIPGFGISLKPLFLTSQLAPNGKIYIKSSQAVRALHIIHNPDEKGAACNFEQKAMMLPNLNYSMPTFPNYRLGTLEGSACDTITTVSVASVPGKKASVELWPNPATDVLNIKITGINISHYEKMEIKIRDALGREVQGEWTFISEEEGGVSIGLRLGDLPSGVYFCEGRLSGETLFVEKFVVL